MQTQTTREAGAELLELVAREAPVGIAVFSGPEHRYEMANAAYERFARGKGDLIGRTAGEVWPEAASVLTPVLDRVYQTGEPYQAFDMPLQLIRDKGPEEVFVTASFARFHDESTGADAVLTIIQETTEYVLSRRTLEAAVAAAERNLSRLEAVIQGVDDGVIICDPQGSIVNWNAKALAIHDIWDASHAPRTVADLAALYELCDRSGCPVPPDDWPTARALRGEVFSNHEARVRRLSDGKMTVFSYGGAPICDKDGKVTLAVVTVEDVTERVRENEALRESNTRLRLATEAADMGTWHWDIARGALAWDDKCKLLFGLPAEAQMSYDVFLAAVHPDDRSRVDEAVRAALFQHKDYGIEFRVLRSDGATRVLMNKGRVFYNDRGKPESMVGVSIDVTERRGVEEALWLTGERFRSALKESPTNVMAHDRDLRYTWVYQPWGGIEPEDIAGKRDDEILPPADAMELVAFKRSVLESGTGMRREIPVRIHGRDYVFDMKAEPLRDASGQATGIIIVATDITEHKRVLADLRSLSETLEKRVADRTARLRALAEVLSETESRERRRLAELLHDNLQQLLAAARIQTQALKARAADDGLRKTAAELDDLLRQSIDASRSLALDLSPRALYHGGLLPGLRWLANWDKEKYGLEVAIEAGDDFQEPPEQARVFLFQAVRELLFNIVKHSGAKTARVALTRSSPSRLAVTVTDQGIGFDATKAAAAQTGGFGLFSIRERLEALGGIMEVESEPKRGTRVSLSMPAYSAAPQPPQGAQGAAKAAPRRKPGVIRVLLVDDHKILREGLAGIMRAQGDMDVVAEAADGEQAVGMARETVPDVVIMDVNLPHMSGIEATKRIKTALPDVAVIGLSMYEDADLADKMREAGASSYLSKGGPAESLLSAIREAKKAGQDKPESAKP